MSTGGPAVVHCSEHWRGEGAHHIPTSPMRCMWSEAPCTERTRAWTERSRSSHSKTAAAFRSPRHARPPYCTVGGVLPYSREGKEKVSRREAVSACDRRDGAPRSASTGENCRDEAGK
ncbi:hypothetical protein MRX96_045138 [Rhipicephalus microplus]